MDVVTVDVVKIKGVEINFILLVKTWKWVAK